MSCTTNIPDVISFETRIAIYGYVFCSLLLGIFTWIGAQSRRQIENESDQVEYTARVVKHLHEVNETGMALALMGTAIIIASVLHQIYFHTFGLFHAYVVLLLLWLISLTSMWFVIHGWVFDILRRPKRRLATLHFWKRILLESKWFTIQLSLMGGYGLYVFITRDRFPPGSDCTPRVFEMRLLCIILYAIFAAPVVNSCILFVVTSLGVWILSLLCALLSGKGLRGQVDPVVFCILWLFEYVGLAATLIVMVETQIRQHTTQLNNGWPFGSTLALLLIIIPLRIVLVRAWRLRPGYRDQGSGRVGAHGHDKAILPYGSRSQVSSVSQQTLASSVGSSATKIHWNYSGTRFG